MYLPVYLHLEITVWLHKHFGPGQAGVQSSHRLASPLLPPQHGYFPTDATTCGLCCKRGTTGISEMISVKKNKQNM